jgi:RNA polymerase sigma-70 factor (ECF subfamily)
MTPMVDSPGDPCMRDEQRVEIAGTFHDCHADLVAFFARQQPDADAAADLAAESVLQWLRKLAAGTRPESLRAYLFGIARHVGMAARRQQARRPAVVDGATLAAVEAAPADDAVAAARELLARLPPRQRDVLELRFVTGLSYAEIADRLDIPLGTVRSRIHHAVALLRSRMPAD